MIQTAPRKPLPRSLFVPRVRQTNFILSVLVTSVKLAALLIILIGLAGVGVLIGVGKAYVETAPELDVESLNEHSQTSFIYDASGNLITTYKGTEDRVFVSITEMPTILQHAFVAVEDARFYSHNGVDVKRIIGAFVNNFISSSTQGGSTITQQLIKQRLLSDEQSYKRKIQEAYLAMELESKYAKELILESYLNTIFLGENYYGVKTAAMGYFGKDLKDLSLRECAMLAGVTRSPYYYNPRRNFYLRNTPGSETPAITNNRTDYVLRMMYENKFITYEEYRGALITTTANVREKAPGSENANGMYEHPYYVEYALHDVVSRMLALYQWDDTSANRSKVEQKLRTGGYSIYLCIDNDIQSIVENTLATWTKYPKLRNNSVERIYRARNADGTYTEIEQPQAAAAVVDYRTGEIKAIVGGRTTPTQKLTLNRAWEMRMPVGSSIKPLAVYAPALERGNSPASIVFNMPLPITGWRGSDGSDSYPQNYGGGGFTGAETLRNALRTSHNTSAAQALMTYVGVENSYAYMQALGIAEKNLNKDGFGLALGSSGITPLQMSVAFGAIANSGVYLQPTSFSRVIDSSGNVILDTRVTQERRQVFGEATAWMATDMMKEAIARGTGTNAIIKGQTVAGKTGTNSDFRGVFFAGFTGWYSGAVWIGHDNYKPLASDATGGDYAAPLWQAFMSKIHEQKGLSDREPIEKSAESVGLIRVTTCGVSGKLATEACRNDMMGYKTVTDYWLQGTQPTEYCPMHKQYEICQETGLIATEYCPSRKTQSAIFIPYGHPLYDYTRSYSKTIQKYLGNFATLHITGGINERDAIAQQMVCTVHTAPAYTVPDYGNQGWYEGGDTSQDMASAARSLISQAYAVRAAAASFLSADEDRAFLNAILTLDGMLYTNTSASEMQSAMNRVQQYISAYQ
ncbi:MAG: transglycosylase domain-containing protein [Oscillospiraceae bacterium]|jgi:penicillin-binding protein 1A|nr:transglycosylase domain-containing protein [Oscillospiraceae bacterium]